MAIQLIQYNTKMDMLFMNSLKRQICDPHSSVLNLTYKINLKRKLYTYYIAKYLVSNLHGII